MEAVVFFICAAVILGGALGVIVLRNPVHAALSLVATLFGVAIIFINLEAYFLAAIQVIVYAGAIVVLFLFVIMLLGVDRAESMRAEPIIGQRQIAMLMGAAVLAAAILIGISVGGGATGASPSPDSNMAIQDVTDPEQSNIRQLARVLFTDYVFAFEITSILLTIAVVGAVILARKPKGELQDLPDVEPPSAFKEDFR